MYHARINHFFGSILLYIVANMTPLVTLINFRLSKNINRLEVKEFSLKVNLTKLAKMLSNVVDLNNFQRQ